MNEYNTNEVASHYSPRASLVALGLKVVELDFLGPLRQQLTLPQKTVKYSPFDKLMTAFVAILTGASGLVEINKRVKADPALFQAFGLAGCAEQSVVQTTLSACSSANVVQLEQATRQIYQRHSRGYHHNYAKEWQVLDGDITGLPCGPKAALATKGYFAKQRNRRGRQVGRVIATAYQEIVVEQLFAGTLQLNRALPQLVEESEDILELDKAKRARTIWRLDGGGGSQEDLGWLLKRGYQVIAKEYSAKRASQLCQSVTEWVDDPLNPGRQVGWIKEETTEYVRPVKRIGVRCKKQNGQWGYAVLITTLPSLAVLELAKVGLEGLCQSQRILLAYAYFYDKRGGGIETTFKEDKQGLGLNKRNKKSFWGQAVLVGLSALGHNLLVWAREWLGQAEPKLRGYGIKRLVRDIFGVAGLVSFDRNGHITQLSLNAADNLAPLLVGALVDLLALQQVAVILCKT